MSVLHSSMSCLTLAATLTLSLWTVGAQAAINYTGTAYVQDFNSFTGGAWANDATLPGWSLFRRPAPGTPISSVTAGSGTSNAGAFYSFSQDDGDQALGGVGSGGTYWGSPSTNSVAGWMSVALSNGTGSSIDAFTIEFDGEQWRDGGNTSQQTMVFEYGFGASFDTVGTWTPPGGTFDFISPTTSGPAGTRNGNDSANRVENLGGEISGIGWSAGDTLWLRWIELNDAGNDHGLAIDDFSFSTGSVVEPIDDADFDADGDVDGRDFLTWQRGYGIGFGSLADGDANGDNAVDGLDLTIWQNQYSSESGAISAFAVPEPSHLCLAAIAMVVFASRRSVS